MRRSNINFRRTSSDRKAERSFKASFYRRLEPLSRVPFTLNRHLRSKFPEFHAKMSSFLTSKVNPPNK